MNPEKTAEGISAVAARSAATLRQLIEKNAELQLENNELRSKVASYERSHRVTALARQLEERGLSPELTFEEKVASVASYPDLDLVENSIKLAGSGRLDLARVADDSRTRPASSVDHAHSFYVNGQ